MSFLDKLRDLAAAALEKLVPDLGQLDEDGEPLSPSERAAEEFLRVSLDRAPMYLLAGSLMLSVVVVAGIVVHL